MKGWFCGVMGGDYNAKYNKKTSSKKKRRMY